MTSAPLFLHRKLLAFVHQELAAPVTAVGDLAAVLLRRAHTDGPEAFVPDAERIVTASAQLQRLIEQAADARALDGLDDDDDFTAFSARLRHDLRTPINAIKGYGEILSEDARDGGHESLTIELTRLLHAADELLAAIGALAKFGNGAAATTISRGELLPSELVKSVRDSIRLVSASSPDARTAEASSRILVVDDAAANRDLLVRRLARDGHRVEAVDGGRAALARVVQEDFDLLLLDLVMPEMNGFEVLSRLKANAHLRHIPVIMISALDEIDSIAHCIEAGAEDYLPKPFNPILLDARINASLERKRWRDRELAFTRQLQAEKEVSEALLLNILPKTIVERMRQGETVIADRVPEVTILFSDLVGFTPLANRFSPGRTVDLLNQLFSEFDHLASELGLEKIKTIGDAYMVAGGLPEQRSDHAVAVAEMALRMSQVVSETGARVGEPLSMRIGIHSGDVVAGVIGRHKFTYDVWGDTVNTASRLESYGLPSQIHLSAETYRRINHAFRCHSRGPVEIAGKGAMQTYFLAERRN
ncbi:MAG: response regulator [Methylobacteriaceae bacterium]|nr:response regulator [Methylobacteriaceae bacterium]